MLSSKYFKDISKYTYILEIFSLLSILNLINVIWNINNIGFIGVRPHPYWIVVLAIAVKYELRQSLTAAVFSGVVYYNFLIISHRVTSLGGFFDFEYFRPVLLFFVVGSIIGQIRKSQNQKFRKLQKENVVLGNKLASLSQNYSEAVKMKHELSERIVSQTVSVSKVYQLFKKVCSDHTDQLPVEALNFIQEIIGAEKCSFYIYEHGKLKLKASKGWPHDPDIHYNIINNKIVRRALFNKKVMALSEIINEEIYETPETIEHHVIMSAPVVIGKEKKVYGILNIEKMPFLKFNADTINLFSIVADWVSYCVNQAIEKSKPVYLDYIFTSKQTQSTGNTNQRQLEPVFDLSDMQKN